MARVEFEAESKHLGSPLVVAYDEVAGQTLQKSSVLLSRRFFHDQTVPKRVKVIVDWDDE